MIPKSTEEVLPFTCPKIDELRADLIRNIEYGARSSREEKFIKDAEQGVFAECLHARQMLRHHWDETLSHAKWLLAAKDEEIAHLKKELAEAHKKHGAQGGEIYRLKTRLQQMIRDHDTSLGWAGGEEMGS